MKKIKYLMILSCLIAGLSSCDIPIADSHDTPYAKKWFKTSETEPDVSWAVVKLDMSDQSFEFSKSILHSGGNTDDYIGHSKGSITIVDDTALKMTVQEKYYNGKWYNREAYIELQMALGQNGTDAAALADNIYISTTTTYLIAGDPATLTITGWPIDSDFNGIYYSSVIASL
ncbi:MULTISPECIES: hypothetical protein [unclassified Oceanispirochaeta]|uniref:hypothetical protein n=1 Tax=unclassified Oceanispirochaeta TaxID=2635722 RepID=UPI000E0942F6|nr:MULTISPECIES: hypothetical protein [unclassified Oceanispirochaeta]MBF9018717.1 hypothetical protein [Oceanispirochaeta sp. M2]NPD75155.1 hypothetical protein [Oceanispirochaeta sp. M1]RDG29007.1 hypothetical protein DV872_23960 [Oceanispirochaeta sp. M1]